MRKEILRMMKWLAWVLKLDTLEIKEPKYVVEVSWKIKTMGNEYFYQNMAEYNVNRGNSDDLARLILGLTSEQAKIYHKIINLEK